MRKRRWLWVILFVFMAGLLGTLATGWNVVLMRDYQKILELARNLPLPYQTELPWVNLVLGTLGFVAALSLMVLFFVRLLHEMRLNQQQSEFLAAVTHELKTPIAAIDLSGSLLRQGGLTEEDSKRLWKTHQLELKRLRDDVETLLETARWQANPPKPKRAPISLESWIERSLQRWKDILGPEAKLERKGDPLVISPLLDEPSLNLIADNILTNARKFAQGSPQVTIETRILPGPSARRTRWEISFRDNGWGFDPTISKKIFQRFFRGRNLAPYAIPGTGLGLSLAASAARASGVRLFATSGGRGRGATFTIQGTYAGPPAQKGASL